MYFVSLFKDLYSNHDCGFKGFKERCLHGSDNTLLLHRVLPEEEDPRCCMGGGGGDKGEGDGGGGKEEGRPGRRGREGGVS